MFICPSGFTEKNYIYGLTLTFNRFVAMNAFVRIFPLALALALSGPHVSLRASDRGNLKPRLVVCTDIGSPDVEPDDMESAVRLMAYADRFEIEGILTTVGWNCDPYPEGWEEYLHKVVDAYEHDVPNLMNRSAQKGFLSLDREEGMQKLGYWPSPEYIRSRCMPGSSRAGIGVIGEGNDSPGSELLIRLADEADERPIYVAAWGSANTLAQAIWRVRQTRSEKELREFVRKFRVFTITDQDMVYAMRADRAYSSHRWLRSEFEDDLMFIWDEGTWTLQNELGIRNWGRIKTAIQGKGALGAAYPDYKWGVEGDTPSFLYLMPNGLNDPEDPTQAGWGGYHTFAVCADSLTRAWTSWQEPVYSITRAYMERFYPDALSDFMARMQWAASGEGNTNPVVVVNGRRGLAPVRLRCKAGKVLRLNASKSYDPEGDGLNFKWWQQEEIGSAGGAAISSPDSAVTSVYIPKDASGQQLHFICEVHDDGEFNLAGYRRVIVDVE